MTIHPRLRSKALQFFGIACSEVRVDSSPNMVRRVSWMFLFILLLARPIAQLWFFTYSLHAKLSHAFENLWYCLPVHVVLQLSFQIAFPTHHARGRPGLSWSLARRFRWCGGNTAPLFLLSPCHCTALFVKEVPFSETDEFNHPGESTKAQRKVVLLNRLNF